jgi:hypothetical protein
VKGLTAPAPLLDSFATFAERMLASRDIDPVYPVLRELVARPDIEGSWLTVLYLAYYNLPSALIAYHRHPEPSGAILTDQSTLKLPPGVERRNLRDPHLMADHIYQWLSAANGAMLSSWMWDAKSDMLTHLFWQIFPDEPPEQNYQRVWQAVMDVRHNGRWAAYKATEVFQKVFDWPLRASDAGHENSTGPRKGLALLYGDEPEGNSPDVIDELNRRTDQLGVELTKRGVNTAVEEVETLLCDFKSMAHGRYFVGHDTDLMLEQGLRQLPAPLWEKLAEARSKGLPHEYLGEVDGRWSARSKALMRQYAETGVVGDRAVWGWS